MFFWEIVVTRMLTTCVVSILVLMDYVLLVLIALCLKQTKAVSILVLMDYVLLVPASGWIEVKTMSQSLF